MILKNKISAFYFIAVAVLGSWVNLTSSVHAQTNCISSQTFTGDGTYYGATGAGNCSFDASPNDLMVGALNNPQYGTADYCGACAKVKGPKGEILIRLVDKCPECKQGDIDFSAEAFDKIADRIAGRVPISWTFTECPVNGNLQFKYKEGSSAWWIGVQVRNHRYTITRFEFKNGAGQWQQVPRKDYNYFIQEGGMDSDKNKTGPYHFRITDINGQVVEAENVVFNQNEVVQSAVQFPVCKPTSRKDIVLNASMPSISRPNEDVLICEIPKATQQIQIQNMNGQVVWENNILKTSNTTTKITVSTTGWASGLYLVRYLINGQVKTQKVIL